MKHTQQFTFYADEMNTDFRFLLHFEINWTNILRKNNIFHHLSQTKMKNKSSATFYLFFKNNFSELTTKSSLFAIQSPNNFEVNIFRACVLWNAQTDSYVKSVLLSTDYVIQLTFYLFASFFIRITFAKCRGNMIKMRQKVGFYSEQKCNKNMFTNTN